MVNSQVAGSSGLCLVNHDATSLSHGLAKIRLCCCCGLFVALPNGLCGLCEFGCVGGSVCGCETVRMLQRCGELGVIVV